jgi:hypothetical protein
VALSEVARRKEREAADRAARKATSAASGAGGGAGAHVHEVEPSEGVGPDRAIEMDDDLAVCSPARVATDTDVQPVH